MTVDQRADPIPCGYCTGPIPEGRPKWATYCGEECGRAAVALRTLRDQRRLSVVAARQAEAEEFERRTNADLVHLIHPRPADVDGDLLTDLHPCHRCGIDTMRADVCVDCEEVA